MCFVILYVLQTKGFNISGTVLCLYKIVLSVIIIEKFSAWKFDKFPELLKPLLSFFERYSYSIYLCHHIWVLGVLSVVFISNSLCLNIIFALIMVFFSAVAFQSLLEVFNKKFC